MIIRLKVFEQTLSIVDTRSVPRKGSKDYLVFHFLFSSDWKDLNKVCYLQHGEVSQPIDVVDNLVEVPEWFTQQDSFDVTLFGKGGTQEVPTNVVSLRLEKSNTLWEQDAPEPQPSWLAKVIDLNNHPPVPGDNGYWMLWDTESGAYVESNLPQSSVQPDWNQNDDTAENYVKNRPFYTGDPVGTVLVEESTISFEDWDGMYGVNFPSTFEATVGETYKISWDGTVYECTCVAVSEMPFPLIGNLSIMGAGSDTGEPFLMATVNGKVINIITADTSGSHTISISGMVAPVVKIDKKYLPSTIPFMEDGKIPEKYVQEKFPDVADIFGGRLIGASERLSTLANPYPNKTILNALTVEAFNAMLNNQESIPRQVMIDNNLALVSTVGTTAISVEWSECRMYSTSDKPIAGAWVQAYKAKIHEDTDNPGTMVSECAVIRVTAKGLT